MNIREISVIYAVPKHVIKEGVGLPVQLINPAPLRLLFCAYFLRRHCLKRHEQTED